MWQQELWKKQTYEPLTATYSATCASRSSIMQIPVGAFALIDNTGRIYHISETHITWFRPRRLGLNIISSVASTQVPYSMLIINPLNPELNPICYLLALLGAHHFIHVSRIRIKLLTFRLLMSYVCGAPILDVSRSHTTTQHSR